MNFIVFFYCDKQLALVSDIDVNLGQFETFSLDDWKNLGDAEAKVMVIYDNQPYEACIILVVPDQDDCADLLYKMRQAISKKNFGAKNLIKFCGRRVKSGGRSSVFPLQLLQTEASETSEGEVHTHIPSRSEGLKENICAPILLPLPSSTPTKATTKRPHQDGNSMPRYQRFNKRTLEDTSITQPTTSFHSQPSERTRVDRSFVDKQHQQSTICPQDRQRRAILAHREKMEEAAASNGIDPHSFEGLTFYMASFSLQLSKMQATVASFDSRLAAVESAVRGGPSLSERPSLSVPVFKEVDDMNHPPPGLKNFIRTEGGSSADDHVKRVMNKLLDIDLQRKLNRTGGYRKTKFNTDIEDLIKESTIAMFPGTTVKDVENLVAKFFKNSRDRFGGRMERRFPKPTPSKHEPVQVDLYESVSNDSF